MLELNAKLQHSVHIHSGFVYSVMAGWSPAQRLRLGLEKNLLEKYFPGRVQWYDPTGNTVVEVSINTNNGNAYRLRIYLAKDGELGSDFPNSMPDMVVSMSPRSMLDWGVSDTHHTVGKRDGLLKICHYHPSQWTNESSLHEVFMKGRIWLEAYEGHIRTGKTMNTFLGEMRG